MPFPLLPVLAGGGSLLQGFLGSRGARAERRAAQQNSALMGQRYEQARGDAQPYMAAGSDSIGRLQAVNNGDYTGFYDSPDYQATLTQGLGALDRSAAARGNLGSGGTDADRIAYGQGLAAQQLGAYRNSLMGVAGLGANVQGNVNSLGASYSGAQAGQNNMAGAARASGYNAWSNALGGVADAFGNWQGGNSLGGLKGAQPYKLPGGY